MRLIMLYLLVETALIITTEMNKTSREISTETSVITSSNSKTHQVT